LPRISSAFGGSFASEAGRDAQKRHAVFCLQENRRLVGIDNFLMPFSRLSPRVMSLGDFNDVVRIGHGRHAT
jgi:hypothetical protein